MADNEVRATLIIAAKDETAAAMSSAATETKTATEEIKKSGAAAGDSGKKWQGMTDAADSLKVPLAGAAAGLAAVYGAIELTAGATVRYAEEVRDLGRAAGIGAEESSKLIQVADDAKVSYETLKLASRQLIREGIQPSIENLSALADEYNALTDPVERSQFLLEKFGRAGLEMGKLLELGAAGIREGADAAEDAGLVMSEEALKAAREYEMGLDDLGDAVQGLTYKIGNALIPTLNDAMDGLSGLIGFNSGVQRSLSEHAKEVQHSAVGYAEYTQELQRAAKASGYWVDEAGNLRGMFGELIEQNYILSAATRQSTNAAEDNASALKESEEAARQKAIADKEAAEAANEWAEAANETLIQVAISGKLSKAQESYNDVIESTSKSIAEYREELSLLQEEQGKAANSSEDLKDMELDLADARFNEEQAAIALAKAQRQLSENTDPTKQSDLSESVEKAELGYNRALRSLEKMTNQYNDAAMATIDNTEKMGDLNEKIAEQEEKAGDAKTELAQLTKEFTYQIAAAGENSETQLELAKSLGLVDKNSFSAAKSVLNLKSQYDDGAISADNFAKKLAAVAFNVNKVQSSGASFSLTDSEVKGYQYGGDFVVPAGYPNDSYRMGVSSGERVSVTPAGTNNSNNKNVSINVYPSSGIDLARLKNMIYEALNS